MMKVIKKTALIFILISLTSCGFFETELKDHFRCAYVAKQLGLYEAENEISIKMQQYIIENKIQKNTESIAYLGQEVRDELALYKYNTQGKILKLLDIYNSSTCQGLHSQGEMTPEMY